MVVLGELGIYIAVDLSVKNRPINFFTRKTINT